MIIIFTSFKFSRIVDPARNARKYELRENVYVHSIYFPRPNVCGPNQPVYIASDVAHSNVLWEKY